MQNYHFPDTPQIAQKLDTANFVTTAFFVKKKSHNFEVDTCI